MMLGRILSVFATRALQLGLGLIGGVLISRALGPSGRGSLALISLVVTLVVSLANLGLGTATTHLVGRGKAPIRLVGGNLLASALGLGVGGILLGLLGYATFRAPLFGEVPLAWVVLALLAVPPLLLAKYGNYLLLGRQRVAAVNGVRSVQAVSSLLLILVLVWWLPGGVPGALLATTLAAAVAGGATLWLMSRETPLTLAVDWPLARTMFSGGWAPYVALIVMNLNFRVDVALLQWLRGTADVGQYAIAASVAEKLAYLPEAIALVLLAEVSNRADTSATEVTVASLRRAIWIVGAGSAVIFFLAEPVVPLLYGEAFRPAVAALKALLPAMLGLTIYQILHSDLTGRGRAQVTVVVFSAALILNVLLNLWWIPIRGPVGASAASTVSYLAGAIALAAWFRRTNGATWSSMFLPSGGDVREVMALTRRLVRPSRARG